MKELGVFKSKTELKLRMASKMKMRKLLTSTMTGNYNGSFQMAGDWLKVFILCRFRKMT